MAPVWSPRRTASISITPISRTTWSNRGRSLFSINLSICVVFARHLRNRRRDGPHRSMELGLADSAADKCEDALRARSEWPHRRHDQPAVRRQRRLLDRRDRRCGGGRDGGGLAGWGGKARGEVGGRLGQMARGPFREENGGGGW